jgi:hypothetical protein
MRITIRISKLIRTLSDPKTDVSEAAFMTGKFWKMKDILSPIKIFGESMVEI